MDDFEWDNEPNLAFPVDDDTFAVREGLTPKVLVSKYQSLPSSSASFLLEGLERIEWSRLHHAHGEASDTPALLRALLSEHDDHRDFACQLLHETIWHQGCVYEATIYVVPFLFRLLSFPQADVRSCVTSLLSAIAHGNHYLRYQVSQDGEEHWREWLAKQGLDLDTELAREADEVAACKAAVGRELEQLYPYVLDADPHVRQAIAEIFAQFPERSLETRPLLTDALALEENMYAKQAIQITLTLLSS